MLFTFIIVFHELGHILFAIIYKWKIEKIILLPFGALTVFHEKINRPLKEEFIILIMGPIFQIIITCFLYQIYGYVVFSYSMAILIFNMLPIYPLDGAKLLNIILNKITSFKKSHLFTIYISILTIILILIKVKFNLIFILILLFVGFKVIEEIKNHNSLFNLFLFERYNYRFDFKKRKIINDYKQMKKDTLHLFKIKNKYLTEKQALRKRFDFNK